MLKNIYLKEINKERKRKEMRRPGTSWLAIIDRYERKAARRPGSLALLDDRPGCTF
jgi:hypothetical protein